MPPDHDLTRHRRRAAAFAAATVAAFIPLDRWLGGGLDATVARCAWVALVLALGFAPREERDWHPDVLGVSSAILLTANIAATGGSRSLYLGYLYALPLALLVLYPDRVRAGVLTGLAGLVAGTAMLAAEGISAGTLLAFAGVAASSVFMAAFGGYASRRTRDAERTAAEARRRELEDLAESERRRAQSERLALVGQLAAGVAHEVNNPLSYVKTSLGVVRDLTAPLPLAPADREELSLAVSDAVDGLARIQSIVEDLRAFARGDDDPLESCDPALAVEEALRVASPPRARKGTGLGLSLSREYLVRYGATIEHAPAPSGGARFTLRLPLAPGRAPAEMAAVQSKT